jgi:AcrR family transcriptional regulator
LHTAGEIFAEKGFHAATVREICQKAGANIASISYYFGDKERLYIETVKEAARYCEAAAPWPTWPPGTPPQTKLRDFVRTFLTRIVIDREPAWHRLLIMRELVQPTRACVAFVDNFVRPTAAVLQAIVGEVVPADMPVARRRLIAFSIIGQCLHYRFARPIMTLLIGQADFDAYGIDQLTDHITAFSLAGLEKAARPEGGQA